MSQKNKLPAEAKPAGSRGKENGLNSIPNYTHLSEYNQILPARPNIAALILLDDAETKMARAGAVGDSDAWVAHCSIWFALHRVAFRYGRWANG